MLQLPAAVILGHFYWLGTGPDVTSLLYIFFLNRSFQLVWHELRWGTQTAFLEWNGGLCMYRDTLITPLSKHIKHNKICIFTLCNKSYICHGQLVYSHVVWVCDETKWSYHILMIMYHQNASKAVVLHLGGGQWTMMDYFKATVCRGFYNENKNSGMTQVPLLQHV